MDNQDKIIMLDDAGNDIEAHILNVMELDGCEYLLYTVDVNDEEESIYAKKIVKNDLGEEDFLDITDKSELDKIGDAIRKIVDML